jgi:hypothetical protein
VGLRMERLPMVAPVAMNTTPRMLIQRFCASARRTFR